jgi:hypothetical protein
MNKVETVVPLGRQAGRKDDQFANGVVPGDWQLETFLAPDFEWQMR